jgi:hypothetical protein
MREGQSLSIDLVTTKAAGLLYIFLQLCYLEYWMFWCDYRWLLKVNNVDVS